LIGTKNRGAYIPDNHFINVEQLINKDLSSEIEFIKDNEAQLDLQFVAMSY
jgi:hypothetical protein